MSDCTVVFLYLLWEVWALRVYKDRPLRVYITINVQFHSKHMLCPQGKVVIEVILFQVEAASD